MNQYVATFHTHLSALRSCRALGREPGLEARMAPVPRALSSSCGTCVIYRAEDPALACLDRDLEAVYLSGENGFVLVHQGED